MPLSSDPDRCREEAKGLFAELRALEDKAGIGAQMTKARDHLPWPDFDELHGTFADTRYGSQDAAREERWRKERSHDQERRLTREAYFGLPDVESRKALIATHRRLGLANWNYWQAENREAHARFDSIGREPSPLPLATVFNGILLIFGGYLMGSARWLSHLAAGGWGVPGAVSGGLIGVVLALRAQDLCERDRRRAVADAKESLNEDDRIFQEEAGNESWMRYPCGRRADDMGPEPQMHGKLWGAYRRVMRGYGRKLVRLLHMGWTDPHGEVGCWRMAGDWLS
ncbi:MAG: hypothetical protein M3T55_03175 [Pseudomonadota bacterium]|nr:hypothetical protein [Pseudomonadota bacterium]